MATAQHIESSPLYLTAGSVAMAAQGIGSKDKDSRIDSGTAWTGSSAKSRVVSFTSRAPTLTMKAAPKDADSKALSDLASLFTSALDLLAQKADPKAKELLNFLTKLFNDIIDAAPSGKSEGTDDDKSKKSLIESLIAMIRLVLGLELAISKNQGVQTEVQSAFSDKLVKVLIVLNDDAIKKIEDLNKKIEEQKHASFWEKIGMDILGAIAVVVSFIFLGPVAGIIAGTMFALQQTGVTDKMFSGVHSPIARFFAELGFALAVGLAGGGISSLAKSGMSAGVVAASAGASAGNSCCEIEMQNMANNAVRQVVEEEVNGAVAGGVRSAAESSSAFGAVAFNLGMQSLMATDAMMALAEAINNDPDHKKKSTMWVALGLSLTCAIATIGAAWKMSSSVASSAETAATSDSKLNNGLQILGNGLRLVSLGSGIFSGYFGVLAGEAQLEQADIQKSQGPIEALIQLVKMLNDLNAHMAKSQGEMIQNSMDMIRASTEGWKDLTLPMQQAAQVLA